MLQTLDSLILHVRLDIHLGMDWSKFPPASRWSPATPNRLKKLYAIQKQDASYRQFLQNTNVTVTGTIDDHDMGINNGDETYEFKTESGVEFLDFIEKDKQSVMYKRAKNGYGVYGVTVFDFDRGDEEYLLSDEDAGIDPDVVGYTKKPKEFKDKRVAIFVLDVRTNRTPWGIEMAAWRRNYDGDFLGERQWKWFDTALRHSDASVNIIVNGLQVHPFRHPNADLAENWAQFPTSRQRFYDTILKDDVRAPVLVSGDVHMTQLMRKDCWPRDEKDASASSKRSLVEFTTSGMTHSWGSVFSPDEKFHHTWYKYYPMHILSKAVMTLSYWIVPMHDMMVSKMFGNADGDEGQKKRTLFENGGAEGAKQGKQFSLEKNFGEIEIDWKYETVTIRAFGEETNASSPLLAARFSIDQLSGLESMPDAVSINDMEAFRKPDFVLVDGDIIPGSEQICVNHLGPASTFQFVFGLLGVFSFLCLCMLGPQIMFLRLISKRLMKARCTKAQSTTGTQAAAMTDIVQIDTITSL